MTTLPTAVVQINGFGILFVIFNTFGLGLRLPIGSGRKRRPSRCTASFCE